MPDSEYERTSAPVVARDVVTVAKVLDRSKCHLRLGCSKTVEGSVTGSDVAWVCACTAADASAGLGVDCTRAWTGLTGAGHMNLC